MIGCENVCGKCDACETLVWALKYAIEHEKWAIDFAKSPDDDTDCHAEQYATRAVLKSSALAELIARTLRGRGVLTQEYSYIPKHGPLMVWHCANEIHFSYGEHRWGPWRHGALSLGPTGARAALSRILDAGLCSANEAIRLLDAA